MSIHDMLETGTYLSLGTEGPTFVQPLVHLSLHKLLMIGGWVIVLLLCCQDMFL